MTKYDKCVLVLKHASLPLQRKNMYSACSGESGKKIINRTAGKHLEPSPLMVDVCCFTYPFCNKNSKKIGGEKDSWMEFTNLLKIILGSCLRRLNAK
jgi:hypothetical protein